MILSYLQDTNDFGSSAKWVKNHICIALETMIMSEIWMIEEAHLHMHLY